MAWNERWLALVRKLSFANSPKDRWRVNSGVVGKWSLLMGIKSNVIHLTISYEPLWLLRSCLNFTWFTSGWKVFQLTAPPKGIQKLWSLFLGLGKGIRALQEEYNMQKQAPWLGWFMRWCVPGSFLLLKPLRSMETQSLRRFRLVVVFHLQSRHQQVAHIGCWTERRFYRAKPVDRWHCRITPLPFRSCLGLMRDRGKLLSQASVSTHPLVLWWGTAFLFSLQRVGWCLG